MSAQCVILNSSHEPLSLIDIPRAVRLWLEGRVVILEVHEGQSLRTVSQTFPAPRTVVRKTYLKTGPKYYGEAVLNNRNLQVRDDYACRYCGRTHQDLRAGEQLTRDHVQPQSKGGTDTWDNVVTACSQCNHKKDDLTPEEIQQRVRETETALLEILPAPEAVDETFREAYTAAYQAWDWSAVLELLPATASKRKQLVHLTREWEVWRRFLIPTPQKVPTVFEIMCQRRKHNRRRKRR